MKAPFPRPNDERGIALVMAMLVLVVLSLLAAVLVMSVSIERKVSGHDVRTAEALNVAEAGVGEALARLRNGDITLPTSNPKAVAQIFRCDAGSVPVLGTDSTAIETKQPVGQWLTYSTATKSPDALTVKFKTDAARTVIYKYDSSLNPSVQTLSGLPIYVISSSGFTGASVKRIETEVVQKPVLINLKGAAAINQPVTWSGNDHICGFNHRSDTPTGKGDQNGSGNGRSGANGCNENAGAHEWEIDPASGNLTGLWSSGTINNPGAYSSGTPNYQASQPGFYAGPWEALGMTQAQFWSWVGSAKSTVPPIPNGIVYLDNNSTTQDQSGAFVINGAVGELSGFMYVDGDLTLNQNVKYRGLIYVEGKLEIPDHTWILGGLIVRGRALHNFHANGVVLYSKDTIVQELAKYGGQFVTLAWREI